MEYRTLGPEDHDDIISVWKRAGLPIKPRGRDSKEEMAHQMALDPEMFLGCYVDGRLTGMIMGSYDSRKGYINRLAVVKEHRRKGIARALVAEMEKRLRERGFRIITILVEDRSPESMALFSSLGYYRHEDIHYYSKRESDEV